MIRIGQHLGHFKLARFGQPAMEDFEKKVTLKINKDWLCILIASFRAAASKRMLGRADVNKARQIPLNAQMFNGKNKIVRNSREIAFSDFIQRYCPGAALDDDFSATQSRHLRRHPELKWMKAKRNDPVTRKRAEIFACYDFAKANVTARLIDINFGFGRTNRRPIWTAALRGDEVAGSRRRIEEVHGGGGGEIGCKNPEMKIWLPKNRRGQGMGKSCFVRTRPVKSMVEQGDRRMELRENPLIFATRDRLD